MGNSVNVINQTDHLNENPSKGNIKIYKNSSKQSIKIIIFNTINDILLSNDACNKVNTIISQYPPSKIKRWESIIHDLQYYNEDILNTYIKQKHKIFIQIILSRIDLLKLLLIFYANMKTIESNKIQILRESFHKLYNKNNYSYEYAKSQSHLERIYYHLNDDCYNYGEIDYEIYTTIFYKITTIFGEYPNGIFVDLGSGCGQIVYTSCFLGNFQQCIGIEYLDSLRQISEKNMIIWNNMKQDFDISYRYNEIDILWIKNNFLEITVWIEATFIFLHWTTFSKKQKTQLSEILNQCREGTMIITITEPLEIMNDNYILLVKDKCKTSWGIAEYFVFEKITSYNHADYEYN